MLLRLAYVASNNQEYLAASKRSVTGATVSRESQAHNSRPRLLPFGAPSRHAFDLGSDTRKREGSTAIGAGRSPRRRSIRSTKSSCGRRAFRSPKWMPRSLRHTSFACAGWLVGTIRNAQRRLVRLPGEGDMTPKWRCHPLMSPLLAPSVAALA